MERLESTPLPASQSKNYRCCFTGHRPEKLKMDEPAVIAALEAEIEAAAADGVTAFISGMARGVDLWAARLILDLRRTSPRIKLLCAVPYAGFEESWSPKWRQLYRQVLAEADYQKIFYPAYTPQAFQERNRWMVDHCARVIAVYHGGRGGTYNTIAYARAQNKLIRIITT